MMKEIFIHPGWTERFDAALDFYSVPYTKVDIWNHDCHYPDTDLLPNTTDVFLVLDWRAVHEAFQAKDAFDKLVDFCQRGNHLCMYNDRDANMYTEFTTVKSIQSFDRVVPKGSASLVLDCEMVDANAFDNIMVRVIPSWNLKDQTRINHDKICKSAVTHDFLLLMRKKRGRPHRDVLWRHLQSQNLVGNGFCNFVEYNTTNEGLVFADEPIPYQLYGDCWFEIVPETMYQNLWYITEKTIKPMLCQTPFVVLTVPGYLAWLRSQGFRTFDTLIDESYDNLEDLEDRTKALVDQVHRIIHDIGSENFYQQSRDICQHNFQHVNSKIGSWYSDTDRVIHEMIKELVK